MAPAYKAAVWRVAKLFNEDFGVDHDVTSFAATILSWSREPLCTPSFLLDLFIAYIPYL